MINNKQKKYRIIKKRISQNNTYFSICKELCLFSKNIRNKALNIINSHFNTYKTYTITIEQAQSLGFTLKSNSHIYYLNVLYHLIKNTTEFRCISQSSNQSVNTKALKQTLKSVNEEFSSYKNALKAYHINKNKFKSMPKPPAYRNEKQQYKITFPSDAISCNTKKKIISLGNSGLIFPMAHIFFGEKLYEIEINPTRNGYELNICIEDNRQFVSIKDINKISLIDTSSSLVSKPRILSMDLGIKHLATMVCNDLQGLPESFATMVGTGINFLNRKTWYRTDKIRSDFNTNVKDSKLLSLHEDKRNRRIYTMFHTYSKRVVEYCLLHGITKVICGNNPGWKEKVNLGKNTNRKFYGIAYKKFMNMLNYKLERHDIDFIVQEESYTSKCSFIDRESIEKHDVYLGKRKSRGLFVSNKGIRMNADINGALNIMRKCLGEDIFHDNRHCYSVLNPRDILPHVKLIKSLLV
jgi:IS605 OrfB family transposase